MNTATATSAPGEAAARFLARGDFGCFIGGDIVPALSGETIETLDPSTGRVLGRLAAGSEADVDRAVAVARKTFLGSWSKWTPYERQTLLHRVHDVLDRNCEELAQIESLDMGAPIARTRANKSVMLKMALFYASQCGVFAGQTLQNGLQGEMMTVTLRAPAGVASGIIPWNGPMLSQWWIIGPNSGHRLHGGHQAVGGGVAQCVAHGRALG